MIDNFLVIKIDYFNKSLKYHGVFKTKAEAEFHVDELVKLGYLNRTTHRNQFFIVTGYFVPEVEIFPTRQKLLEKEI